MAFAQNKSQKLDTGCLGNVRNPIGNHVNQERYQSHLHYGQSVNQSRQTTNPQRFRHVQTVGKQPKERHTNASHQCTQKDGLGCGYPLFLQTLHNQVSRQGGGGRLGVSFLAIQQQRQQTVNPR